MFQGHAIQSLVNDLGMALFPIIVVICLHYTVKAKKATLSLLCLILYVATVPNTGYAFIEIKHLCLYDGIADNLNFASFLIFGGISLIGLLATVLCTLALIRIFRVRKYRIAVILLASILQAIGTAIGVLDVVSQDIILNPNKVFHSLWILFNSLDFIVLIFGFSIFLTMISLVAIKIPRISSYLNKLP